MCNANRIDPPYYGGLPPIECDVCNRMFDIDDLRRCEQCGKAICETCNAIKSAHVYVICLDCLETALELHTNMSNVKARAAATGNQSDLADYMAVRRILNSDTSDIPEDLQKAAGIKG